VHRYGEGPVDQVDQVIQGGKMLGLRKFPFTMGGWWSSFPLKGWGKHGWALQKAQDSGGRVRWDWATRDVATWGQISKGSPTSGVLIERLAWRGDEGLSCSLFKIIEYGVSWLRKLSEIPTGH